MEHRLGVQDFVATLYRHLDIDTSRIEILNFSGRTIPPPAGRQADYQTIKARVELKSDFRSFTFQTSFSKRFVKCMAPASRTGIPNGVDLSSPSGPVPVEARLISYNHKPLRPRPLPRFFFAKGERKRGRGDDLAKRSESSSQPVCGPPTRGRRSREIRFLCLSPRHRTSCRWCPNATLRCIKIFSGIQSLNRL